VGGGFPPDPHAAVGANHFGETVNSAIRFYTKALTGNCSTSIVFNSTLSGFFGYATQPLFDPRIVYDLTFNHWIVSAEAMEESSTIQFQFIAISVDSDPSNGSFVYSLNIRNLIGADVFWDYPQIGYDEKAIILTRNKFNNDTGDRNFGNYIGSMVVFFSKHRMYAGLTPIDFCGFVDDPLNVGTIAPPIVLDQGPYSALVAAAPGLNFIRVTKWIGTSHACPMFLKSDDIVAPTNVPPLAQQPGSGPCPAMNCLDTLDGRFQNASTQFGEPLFTSPVTLWQVRTDAVGSLPTPNTYRVNADALTIDESCPIFASGSSFDFNPSIVANEAGTFFTTWSSTDPPFGVNAQVRIGGKKLGDVCGIAQTGISINQSGNPLTGNFDPNLGFQRWGDYSAVALDPANHTKVWGVNEKVRAGPPTTWRTYIFNMTNP